MGDSAAAVGSAGNSQVSRGHGSPGPVAGFRKWTSDSGATTLTTSVSAGDWSTAEPMTPPFDTNVYDRATSVANTVIKRHLKYGPGNIALSPGGAINGLTVRLHDKLARLANGTMDFEDESLRDTFVDIAGYALIGLMVLDGVWPKP